MHTPLQWTSLLAALFLLLASAPAGFGQQGTPADTSAKEQIARLVRNLGSDDFRVRVNATEDLAKFGREAVAPTFEAAKEGELEVVIRSISVLEKLAISEDEATADEAVKALQTLKTLHSRSIAWRAERALQFANHWAELAIQSIGGRVSTERGENGELVAQIKLEGLPGGKLDKVQRRALKRFPVLVIAGGKVTDADVAFLSDLESLSHLDVRYTQVGDDGIKRLGSVTSLKKLLLSGTRVSDDGLAELERLKQLRVLYLSGTAVSDAGLVHIARLPRLEELNLSQCKAVGDEGAASLSRVKTLKQLNLTGTQITDEGLKSLTRIPGLEGLYLHGTQVTNEGVARFQQALPECRVRH